MRRGAFNEYRRILKEYVDRKAQGAPLAELEKLRDEIRGNRHPTVWKEMQRQWQNLALIQPLFQAAPEALGW
jgi:hypothetical protein